jgi:hypothetical protein
LACGAFGQKSPFFLLLFRRLSRCISGAKQRKSKDNMGTKHIYLQNALFGASLFRLVSTLPASVFHSPTQPSSAGTQPHQTHAPHQSSSPTAIHPLTITVYFPDHHGQKSDHHYKKIFHTRLIISPLQMAMHQRSPADQQPVIFKF